MTGSLDDEAPFLVGDHVELIAASSGHETSYRRWFNDFEVQRTSGVLPMPWSEARFEGFFRERVLLDDTATWFTVLERATGRPVGFCGVRDIDHRNRTAEYFITIGEADCRGKGYGTEATSLTLDYAFSMLGLHSVFLDVISASLGGIRAYEKAGFREIGRRRECELMGGKLYDAVFMECLASEFANPVRARG